MIGPMTRARHVRILILRQRLPKVTDHRVLLHQPPTPKRPTRTPDGLSQPRHFILTGLAPVPIFYAALPPLSYSNCITAARVTHTLCIRVRHWFAARPVPILAKVHVSRRRGQTLAKRHLSANGRLLDVPPPHHPLPRVRGTRPESHSERAGSHMYSCQYGMDPRPLFEMYECVVGLFAHVDGCQSQYLTYGSEGGIHSNVHGSVSKYFHRLLWVRIYVFARYLCMVDCNARWNPETSHEGH